MLISDEWVRAQTNTALQSGRSVDYAVQALTSEQLPLHPDRNKNWDSFLALSHTLRRADPSAAVLDAGAGDESAYLPGLQQWGYTNLLGCNLDRNDDYTSGIKNGVRHVYADMTETPFPSRCFTFVSCLSVIEHGVDWRKFLIEMSRILVVRGELFVSFDYWPRKLDTGGLVTHGAPINIFCEQEVDDILDFAESIGLDLVGKPWNPEAVEAIVHWAGLDYTFGNLLLRKTR